MTMPLYTCEQSYGYAPDVGEKSNRYAPDTCEQSYGYAPDVGDFWLRPCG